MNSFPKLAAVALILALGMIASAAMLSRFFVKIRHEQNITVKGYAEQDIVSDIGTFSCTVSVNGPTLETAYDALQTDRATVLEHLKNDGFAAAEIAVGTIETSKIAKRDAQGRETNEIEAYAIWQSIQVTSTNVARVTTAAAGITDLIKRGIELRADAPAFYVSDMKDIKLALLAQATRDGYNRALTLAENSRGKVGALTSAQQGVFQITERHSTDTSAYGEYSTATIEKTAKAVVTLEYAIEPSR